MVKTWLISTLMFGLSTSGLAQPNTATYGYSVDGLMQPRMRVIIDNDFSGDPDGLFQLVHHLLSPSVEIRAIIGSHLKPGDGFDPSDQTATNATKKINEVLNLMFPGKKFPVYSGSNMALASNSVAQPSAAANAIIAEAMRTDTKLPLYVVCGAGLTDVASAFLTQPGIARRMTLVWIGGPEYGDASPPPGYTRLEYNLGIDRKAAQVIFNKSDIPLWQVPRNAYRQAIISYATLLTRVKTQGPIGAYLVSALERVMKAGLEYNFNAGETYVVGDSPLVLLTALQSSFEPDPSSSRYTLKQAPIIDDEGLYQVNHNGRNIRVYHWLDIPLMLDDFYAKLSLFQQSNQ